MSEKKKVAEIAVISTNPGVKIEVSDERILGLFTDVAGMKVQMKILSAVMFLGFSTIAGLVVALGV